MSTQKPTVHIIGAGFSGLTLGYLLSKSGYFDISVFEKNSTVGGLIYTHPHRGFVVETAAHSILCNSQVSNLLKEIGADYVHPEPTAKKRFFFRDGLTRWPLTFSETLQLIPKIMFHLLTRKKFLHLAPSENVFAWARKHFGNSFAQYFLSPALQGIYAASAEQLNAQLILGSLLKPKKKEKYQGIVSGRAGMRSITETLKRRCEQNGVKFFTEIDYDFSKMPPANSVILCTSAADAAKTLSSSSQSQYKDLAAALEKIQMISVLSVTCHLPVEILRPQGFGCLIPPDQNLPCLGVLFNSDIFTHRAAHNENSETYIFSAAEAERIFKLTETELKQEIHLLRQKLFRLPPEKAAPILEVYKNQELLKLPLYNEALLDFQNHLKCPENIYLHGNYVNGIGLSKIVAGSYTLADSLVKQHQGNLS